MSQIRYDLIHDDYALIAPERLHRPDCFKVAVASDSVDTSRCPFCPGHEGMTPPEIFAIRESGKADTPGWKTRVVPNLYKAVQIEAPWQSRDEGPYRVWEGLGAHEVIIDTPRHLLRMDEWKNEEYRLWLKTLRARINDLRNDVRLVYIDVFKNQGRYAAATQSHPHTQLIALPTVPQRRLRDLQRAHEYFLTHRIGIHEAVLNEELRSDARIVAQNDRFVCYSPYASTFAFETAITARDHAALSDLDDDAVASLASLMQEIVSRLYRVLGDFDFNILFNTPPMQKNSETAPFFDDIGRMWRLHIRILPRLFRMGGFELGSGAMINPVAPEEAARHLKEGREGA